MTTCSPEYMEELLRPVKEVTRWDLEGLIRMYSDDELVELWNEIRSSFRRYLRECSHVANDKLDKHFRGLYQLAQLLIASAFRSRGIDKPGITDRFRDEEYEIILDFEKYKIFDGLDVREIVEYIERREGRVYEFIKEYYAKQYNALDRAWGHLLRDMMSVIEKRYQKRREKMEQATIEYIRRKGLLGTIFEIEETIKKAVETGELRREAVKDVAEIIDSEKVIEEEIEALREEARNALATYRYPGDYTGILDKYSKLENTIRGFADRLKGLLERLGVKYNELVGFEVSGSAKEIIDAEINALSSLIGNLQCKLREYEGLLKAMEAEREALRSRVEELEKILSGAEEGPVVTREEACSLIESYLSRVWSKVSRDIVVYNPVDDRKVKIGSWSDRGFVGGDLCNTGLVFTKKKGIIGKRKHVVVEVRAFAHWEVLREKGYDSNRVGLGEVLDIVSDRIGNAVSEDYYHVLVLASPTGFTSKALEFVSGEYHRRFALRNLTLYLVDLLTGRVHYNRLDEASNNNVWIAEPEYEHEAIKKIIDYVLSEEALIEANRRGPPPHLPIDYIVEATHEPRERVRIALERLSCMGRGRVTRLRTGDTVFIYKI